MNATSNQGTRGPGKSVKAKLLIVDDETEIRWALRKTLQFMNFDVVEAETGEQAIALVRTVRFDIVLLDPAMPGMNGIETCLKIRNLMPLLGIVMLSVNNNEEDKIQALDAGADDYVTKPFHMGELAARIRAIMRRARTPEAEPPKSMASEWGANVPIDGPRPTAIQIGEIEFDPARRLVKRAGTPVHLTPKEFELLHFLMAHAGFPITHTRILETVWGPEYGNELETLRTFVGQLRKKLNDDGASPKYLLTDLQIGYHFLTEADLQAAREFEDHIPAHNLYMVSP